MKDALSGILETPHAEMVATGFGFTEGPVWHKEGFIYFVDIRGSRQLRWSRKTGTQIARENTGEGNGTTLDRQGRMIMCEGGNRRVTRKEASGAWVPIAERYRGKRLNRPNDVVCRSDGTVYFTDPAGRMPPEERELDFSGVMRVSTDGKLSVGTDQCEYPNGLAFSPDEKVLYVAISRLNLDCIAEKERGEVCRHQFIRAFDVRRNGTLANNRIFADMSSAEDGVPDGMKVDVKGRVFCTGAGGCWVFEPDGRLLGVIKLPEVPANLAFGGADWRDLYFTARTSLYLMRTREPGMPVPA
jgi:gluconolactonase